MTDCKHEQRVSSTYDTVIKTCVKCGQTEVSTNGGKSVDTYDGISLSGNDIPKENRLCKCVLCDGTGLIQKRLDSWVRDVLKLGVLISEAINRPSKEVK